MHFLSVRSVLVLPLPVVIAGKQPRGLLVSNISSRVVFAAIKRVVSDRQGFVAIFASGETSCQ
jgi:hypothetical protein